MHTLDIKHLSPAQADGIACVVCADDDGAMIPVGTVNGGQVFAHRPCLEVPLSAPELPSSKRVLVVGNTSSVSDVARRIAYELGRPVTYATNTDYRVTDFAAVYTTCEITSMLTSPALVLVAEALAAGIEVHEPLTADEVAECPCGLVGRQTRIPVGADGELYCAECRGESACTWCGEWNDVEDLKIVEHDGTWYPLHAGCLTGLRHHTSPDVLMSA